MKIGANVNSAKLASIEEFEIASDKVVLTTTENHNFLVGETLIIEKGAHGVNFLLRTEACLILKPIEETK
jgi:hypothetical protein